MIQKDTLPNGLVIITDSVQSIETITIGVWIKTGTRLETSNQNGISHMLEHMMFKGTEKRSAQVIAEEVENVGGYLNAYTSRECTAYYGKALKKDGLLIMDILSDILNNSTFPPEEFKKEQDVVIQEINQAYDTPDDIIYDYFQKACFPNDPLGMPVLGTQETVKSLTPELVRNYKNTFYSPNQMVLSAAGAVDHAWFVNLAKNYFGNLSQGKRPFPIASFYKGKVHHIERDLEQTHLILGFQGVPYTHQNYYTLSVLSSILGGGMASRLFQEVREKRGLAYSIHSYTNFYEDTGLLGIYAGTGQETTLELIKVVCEQLKDLSYTIREEEIERSKAQLKSAYVMELESMTSRCERNAMRQLMYGFPFSLEKTLEELASVSKEDLLLLAKKLFSSPPTLVSMGPLEKQLTLTEETLCDYLSF